MKFFICLFFSFLLLILFPTTANAQTRTLPMVSCPVQDGKIITSSYDANPVGGHCGSGYGYSCQCGNKGRRAKAIDVDTSAGQDVILPAIEGTNIKWKLVERLCAGAGFYPNCVASNGGTGGLYTFLGNDPANPSDNWHLQYVHMDISKFKLQPDTEYDPGTVVGKSDGTAHVHAVIGKNLSALGGRVTGVADCDPNWLPSDFMCDPTKQPPISNSGSTPSGGTPPNGQGSSKSSSKFCTKVGDPKEPSPCLASGPTGGPISPPAGFIHYCQNDPKWPATNGCSMASSGCGPTSLAMVLSTFGVSCNGNICTPAEVDKLMHANGNRDNSCNSVMNGGALGSTWLKNLGVEVGPPVAAGGQLNYKSAKNFIDDGYLIIGSSVNAPSCNCNHIFVLQDVDPVNQTVVVRDPVCKGTQEVQYNYNNINWFYAIPVKAKKII